MSLFKRKASPYWYYKIYPPGGGKEIYGSTGTTNRKKAQELHDRLKADLWNQAKLGHKPRYTWNDAVIRFVEEKADVPSIESIKSILRWLHPHLNEIVLADIDRKLIDEILTARRNGFALRPTRSGLISKGHRVSPQTVNHTRTVLMSVLNSALSWEWIDKVPKVKRLKVPSRRIKWLTQEQARNLLSVLPRHLSEMAYFSLETGLRRRNVTQLKWSQIDLSRKIAWIHPDEAKARKAIPVPLSDTAVAVLQRQQDVRRNPDCTDYVFVYQGKSITQTSTKAWKKALAKVGIEDFRWHDLRHTWASWHAQRGTPLHVLQALGGWETIEMVQRYAHLSADHLAQWVQPFDAKTGNSGAIQVQ